MEVKKWKENQKLKACSLNKSYGDVPFRQSCISAGNEIHVKGDPSVQDVDPPYHITTGYNETMLENINDNIFSSSRSAPQYGILGNSRRITRSSASLIDVKVTIQPNYRAEHVPLVSLVSRLSGKAIIGHPIEIEELSDGSTNIFLSKSEDAGLKVLDNIGTGMSLPPQVWRKAKRTPVCYSPAPSPFCDSEVAKPAQPCKDESYANIKENNNSSFAKQEFLKPLKKRNLSAPNTSELSVYTQQIHGGSLGELDGRNCNVNWQLIQEETEPAVATCVPIKLITSKLLTAVQLQSEADIHH